MNKVTEKIEIVIKLVLLSAGALFLLQSDLDSQSKMIMAGGLAIAAALCICEVTVFKKLFKRKVKN